MAGVPETLPTFFPPGWSALGAELRGAVHRDEREWIRSAVQRWEHHRTLDDVAREYAARGDRVAVEVVGRRFEGQLVAIGSDRMDVQTTGRVVSVHTAVDSAFGALRTPFALRRVAPARRGGRRIPSALVTFRARLLELEERGRSVTLGSALLPEELDGRVAVGRDHVVVRGAGEVVVPTGWVAYVAVDTPSGAG